MKSLSIIDNLKPFSVGFDDMFKHFEDIYNRDLNALETNKGNYNIIKTGKNNYNIEVALPGNDKKDVEISVEDNILKIKSFLKKEIESKDKEYIYKGVEKENIFVSFFIGKDVKVHDAIMEKGLLTVELTEQKPTGKDIKKIPVTNRQ